MKDIAGQRFGRLVAIERDINAGTQPRWRFRCDCGAEKVLRKNHVVSGPTRSCGCILERRKATDGAVWDKAEYAPWRAMWRRCTDEKRHNWDRYGGRGICVTTEWEDFKAFVRDVGPRPSRAYSLDRIDNDGNYEPGNVRWATAAEQSANRSPRRRAAA